MVERLAGLAIWICMSWDGPRGGCTALGKPPSGKRGKGETATPRPVPHTRDHRIVGGENGPTQNPPGPARPSPRHAPLRAAGPARCSPAPGATTGPGGEAGGTTITQRGGEGEGERPCCPEPPKAGVK